MKLQKPAQGILLVKEWSDHKQYRVLCECQNPDHTHDILVSVNDGAEITVSIETESTTSYWTERIKPRYDIACPVMQEIDWAVKGFINNLLNRIALTWEVWRTGKVTTSSHVIMTQQQAYNYAKTLEQAVRDVDTYMEAANNDNAHG